MDPRTEPKPARSFNTHITTILLFGLVGAFLASWIAPKAISWYFDPPVNIGFNCGEATAWSMSRLQLSQLVGLGIGCVGGLAWTIRSARRRNETL